ncbi:glycosyl hydrolase-related protein [Paenibacillus sp. FSL K6-0276]|uniref:glycosyl hydrolase-related protein n=1 Tax=Paenibacillus sp. FSL K6-0276 TaxID=2921450 RepID=UPI0030EC2EE9
MEGEPLFSIEGEHVLVDAIKRSEDGVYVLLRLHEYAGSRKQVSVKSAYPISSWQECNLMEESQEAWREEELAFQIKPYEIRTFRINMGRAQQ